MSFNLNSVALDLDQSTAGVWVEYPLPSGAPSGLEFRIARDGNPRYQEILQDLIARAKRLPGGRFAPGAFDRIVEEAIARGILTGWRPTIVVDGEELEYSVEAALRIIRDDRFDHVREWILKVSKQDDAFLEEALAADSDDLGNTSGGSSRTRRSSRTPQSSAE
jgi:hypothetical protein